MALNTSFISKLSIPDDVIARWQKRVDLVAKLVGVPVCLIREVHQEYSRVRVASAGEHNPYKPGDLQNNDSQSYCGTVIKQRKPLMVANA